MEIIKYPKRQDCYYKLTPGSSNETSINLSYDILYLLCPEGIKKGQKKRITFKIFRDDYLKALCYIMRNLPYYITRSSNSNPVEYSYDLFLSEFNTINNFFRGEVADYSVTLYYRNDGRIYLNDLTVEGFNIRKFFVEERTTMIFSMEERPVIRINLDDNVCNQKDSYQTVSDNIISEPLLSDCLAVRDKVLKDFVFKVVLLISKSGGLDYFEPYVNEISKSLQLYKKGSFRLTGMFINTSYTDMVKRNRLGIKPRWFNTPFTLCGKIVYLSNQWYANGQYALMYDDFKELIITCFGDNYYFSKSSSGEYELWKR